mmetsp:Transcript_9808/g.29882  ORF Transcript_9808/g.29882 Transcript_9808/m.29882 type:complete len:211 (+) Transcript_9808:1766-2398(+)
MEAAYALPLGLDWRTWLSRISSNVVPSMRVSPATTMTRSQRLFSSKSLTARSTAKTAPVLDSAVVVLSLSMGSVLYCARAARNTPSSFPLTTTRIFSGLIPASSASSIHHAMMGLPPTGSSGLGVSNRPLKTPETSFSTDLRNRTPYPAASTTQPYPRYLSPGLDFFVSIAPPPSVGTDPNRRSDRHTACAPFSSRSLVLHHLLDTQPTC